MVCVCDDLCGRLTLPSLCTALFLHVAFRVLCSGCNAPPPARAPVSARLWCGAHLVPLGACWQLGEMVERMQSGWRTLGARESSLWKRRVVLVQADYDDLTRELERFSVRERQRAMEEEERKELLRRTRGGGDAARHLSDIDLESGTRDSAKRSARAVEDMLGMGTAVLDAYASQRERLKSAERKVLTVLNELGLSDSMLRAVEKRHVVDKCILAGGALLTLGMVWWLFMEGSF